MSDKLSRRQFFKVSGGFAAGAGIVTGAIPDTALAATAADAGNTVLPYPRKALGAAAQMAVGQAFAFTYPDDSSPCTAIRMGTPVEGGVGPGRDIVAYSILCTHMGCPVAYDAKSRCFKCPCHYSTFDAEKAGQMVCGQATEDLPRIVLEHDATAGTVTAVAVSGLIYGRQSNIL
jgi:arsenite oxidase small subunit